MRSQATALTAAALIALPLAWLAGEQHRKNCLHTGNVACSVLPWNSGHHSTFKPSTGSTLDDNINRALGH